MDSILKNFNFRILGIIYLLHFIRHGMIFPLIPLYAQKLGAGGTEIGLVTSSFNLLAVFLAIPIGGIIEKTGMRPVLLSGVACNLIYAVLLVLASSLSVLAFAQIFGGLGFLFLIVSSQTYVSHMAENRYRERGFGFLSLAAALGFMLGPPLGGFLIVLFDYAFVFAFSGLLALSCAVGFLLKKQPETEPSLKKQETGLLSQVADMFKSFQFVSILVVCFIVVFVVNLRTSFLPVLLKAKDMDEVSIGLLYALFALAMTMVRLSIGRVMGLVHREKLMGFTLLLLILGTGFLPLLSAFAWLGTAMFLAGAGFGISQPLTTVMVADHRGSGLAMGIRFTTVTLATVLSPLCMGWIVDSHGLDFVFYAGGLMLISLGMFFMWAAFHK